MTSCSHFLRTVVLEFTKARNAVNEPRIHALEKEHYADAMEHGECEATVPPSHSFFVLRRAVQGHHRQSSSASTAEVPLREGCAGSRRGPWYFAVVGGGPYRFAGLHRLTLWNRLQLRPAVLGLPRTVLLREEMVQGVPLLCRKGIYKGLGLIGDYRASGVDPLGVKG